jgi:non-heme chloroperoxidase
MLDAQALADCYVAAWNEPDAAKRSSAIATLWAPDALDQRGARGYAPLQRLIHATPRKTAGREGIRFRAAPTARLRCDVVTFRWEMLLADSETVLAGGLEFLIVMTSRPSVRSRVRARPLPPTPSPQDKSHALHHSERRRSALLACGAGAAILFLSSLGCTSRMWDYQMAAFADEGFRCIGFDRRGHGRSDQPARGYDFDTFADDLAALVENLDLTDLTLIAHSMGGGKAVRYLSRHDSQRVARLILLAPTTPMLLKTRDNPNGLPMEAFEALWAGWRHDHPKWVADNLPPFFVPETSLAMMRWGATLLQTSLPVTLACSRAMAEADFRADMRRIDVPTLIVQSDRDRSVPVELTGKPSADLIPGSRLIVYAGAPHGLMFTHMDQLNADLVAFMRERDARSAAA